MPKLRRNSWTRYVRRSALHKPRGGNPASRSTWVFWCSVPVLPLAAGRTSAFQAGQEQILRCAHRMTAFAFRPTVYETAQTAGRATIYFRRPLAAEDPKPIDLVKKKGTQHHAGTVQGN